MKDFSKNKWKYVTIGLLVVLAFGFSFPQAFAHVTNSLTHNVKHIVNTLADLQSDVTDIKEVTDRLPTDLASQSDLFTQVITEDIVSDLAGLEIVECTSDADFIVHVSAAGRGSTAAMNYRHSGSNTIFSAPYPLVDSAVGLTFGGKAGDEMSFVAVAREPDRAFAVVTMQTAEGAAASCEIV